MAGKKGQKKRFWSDDEKRSICAQTTVAGVSVVQVARRYSMNANLIHTWLKDPRFAPESEGDGLVSDMNFIPIEIEGSVAVPVADDRPNTGGMVAAQRVDITLSDGRRILVEGTTELAAVLGLIKGMMA